MKNLKFSIWYYQNQSLDKYGNMILMKEKDIYEFFCSSKPVFSILYTEDIGMNERKNNRNITELIVEIEDNVNSIDYIEKYFILIPIDTPPEAIIYLFSQLETSVLFKCTITNHRLEDIACVFGMNYLIVNNSYLDLEVSNPHNLNAYWYKPQEPPAFDPHKWMNKIKGIKKFKNKELLEHYLSTMKDLS